MNILIVEPSKVVRESCQQIIGSIGHKVRGVSDGHEAIEALDSAEFDICMINPQLPGNNGIELVYEIASYEDLRATRLVLIADDPAVYEKHSTLLAELGVVDIIKRTHISGELLERYTQSETAV